MLIPDHRGTSLVVCTTCRGPARTEGVGAALATALGHLAGSDIAIEPTTCLWSCDRGASVQLRHPAKTGYVMGGFKRDAAPDLLAFAREYANSVDGDVPYDRWPLGVRGHFIARTPPPGGRIG